MKLYGCLEHVTTSRVLVSGLLAAALLLGCGGGGGEGGVGSGGTGSFASGPITGFGSVIVNGVRFDDSGATVEDGDGVRRSSSDLRLGMTVDIDSSAVTTSATASTASAKTIRYDSELRGPVSTVNAAGNSFTMLGQLVVVDTTTVFDENLGALSSLRPSVLVEVFAVYDAAAGSYQAKRVAPPRSGATTQLRGVATQVDSAAQTLRIGSATYAFAGASGVPAGLAAGQFVRLALAPAVGSSGRWTVLSFGTAVPSVADADGASLKGLVSSFNSVRDFSVNGRPVDASAASFPAGSAGLALGVRVEVQGNLRSGVLRATSVAIASDAQERSIEFELHGAITSVDTASKTFVLRGLTVSTTRSDLRIDNGTAANLAAGRNVQVKGLLSADQLRIDATRISFE